LDSGLETGTLTKILYLIDTLYAGGAERQLSLLLKFLPPTWDTRVVSLDNGQFYQVLRDQKTAVVIYKRRSRFDPIPVLQLYFEIWRYKPDIIHSWGWLCSALVAPLSKILHILLIVSIRDAGMSTRHQMARSRAWTRITMSLSDLVVANSYAGGFAFRAPQKKTSVVYNAMDPDRLQLIKQGPKVCNGVTTVVMTGRISQFKDFFTYFEAARRLSAQEPGRWKFVAIGLGDENARENLRMLADDLIDTGVIDLPQAGLEVLPFVKEANVGVLLSASSFQEGISNSIMEYMACGLPVICSDSGGNRELVIDGETGFIIPSENIDSFVEKLIFLNENPDISHKMGRAGQERVTYLCSIERMISDYELLYIELLNKRDKKIPENVA
jgi:glycosyltransferase involved in cell wall biosynthesis